MMFCRVYIDTATTDSKIILANCTRPSQKQLSQKIIKEERSAQKANGKLWILGEVESLSLRPGSKGQLQTHGHTEGPG